MTEWLWEINWELYGKGDFCFQNCTRIIIFHSRFCGTTEFAPGIWAGVELDTADGKNDGIVKGMRYFHCDHNHGIFVSPNKISKAGSDYKPSQPETKRSQYKPVVNHGKVDVSHVRAKFHTAMEAIAERTEVRVGDRVWVKEVVNDKGCKGTIRFMGSVDFVDDMSEWLGIELDSPLGRHDGTVQGVRYFAAGQDRGVFVTMNKVGIRKILMLTSRIVCL